MTTVRTLRRQGPWPRRVEGKLRWAVLVGLVAAGLAPRLLGDGPVHWRHAGAMPPGAIGRQRLLRGGPLSGYCQPVEIRAPQGARISPAAGGSFAEGQSDRLLVGLEIAKVYRFRVTDVPEHPGVELFPTVEMVDRTYPPPGLALKFPVPVDLTEDELLLAAEGSFVTRVVYIEDPDLATPVAQKSGEPLRWFDVRQGDDPLVTADALGRPVAIVRIGGRVPNLEGEDPAFACGPEPLVYEQPAAEQLPSQQPFEELPAAELPQAAAPANSTVILRVSEPVPLTGAK